MVSVLLFENRPYQYSTLNFIGQAIEKLLCLIKNIHTPKTATRFLLPLPWFTSDEASWFLRACGWWATDFPIHFGEAWWPWMWGPELLQEGRCLGFNSKRWTCGFAGHLIEGKRMKSLVHLTWLAKICFNTEDVFTIEDIDGKFVQSAFDLSTLPGRVCILFFCANHLIRIDVQWCTCMSLLCTSDKTLIVLCCNGRRWHEAYWKPPCQLHRKWVSLVK